MNHRNRLSPPNFPYPWASEWGEDRYGLWQVLAYQGVRQGFRWIPPGKFTMGSPDKEVGRYSWEDKHDVTLNEGFWLGETAVTQALWQAVMNNNPSHFEGEQRPVETVSWDDVQVFIKAVNELHPDLQVRLPWEAEWEYACRAGTESPFNFIEELSLSSVNYRGTWEYEADTWGDGAKQETAEVKTYPCNNWGLYEMHGNVWESCEDAWIEQLGFDPVDDPWLKQAKAEPGSRRVVRGGSWGNDGRLVRSAIRFRYDPGLRNRGIGFRLALGHSSSVQENG